MNELTIIPSAEISATIIEKNIEAINKPVADFLTFHGLPTQNILSPVDERRKVMTSLGDVIEIVPMEKREKSQYLSKFTISVAMGIFDGALTFLWDETVKALRVMIIQFDLDYFYKIAFEFSTRYKSLYTEEDLEAISEHDLLEICRRIGLLNDINHKRLETVNYFRNHASAAHPNDHELSGHELISMLENCIKYAIHYEFDSSIVQIKRLFNNLRTIEIPSEDISRIVSELLKLKSERLDDFVLSIFGLFCDDKQSTQTQSNIENIVSDLWLASTDELKYKIGSKFGYFRIHGDIEKKKSVQRFLDIVGGNPYKDEDSLSEEIREKLNDLRSVHFAWNNFYNESIHALNIQQSLPDGDIPKSVSKEFVKVISICYVGNGKGYQDGIDTSAVEYYKNFIDKFMEREIMYFVLLFSDPEFVTDLDKQKVQNRMKKLITYLKGKSENILLLRLLDFIHNSPRMEKVANTSDYKRMIGDLK